MMASMHGILNTMEGSVSRHGSKNTVVMVTGKAGGKDQADTRSITKCVSGMFAECNRTTQSC